MSDAKPHDAPSIPPWVSWSLMVGVGSAIALLDIPLDGVDPWGRRLLAIFVPTILGLMLRPLPGGALVLLAVTLTILFDAVPQPPSGLSEADASKHRFSKALAGYADPAVWLVLAAYFLSRALIKTGLARRIALTFVRLLGRSTLGLGYALTVTDTLLAGMIPSNAARVGGVVLPATRSLAEIYRSLPGPTAGLLGAYLMLVVYQCDVIACALFLTGQASNPIAAAQAANATGGEVELTYARWALYASAPALTALLLGPWILFRLCRPTITHTPEASEMARRELAAMGSPSRDERLMMFVFVAVCVGWIASGTAGTALTALAGASALFLTRVLTWDDAVSEKGAWDVFIWYGGLVRMGTLLNEAGITKLFAEKVADGAGGLPLALLFVLMLAVYYYAHYGFASITAHILSMYPAFVGVLLALGAPPWLTTCCFAYFGNLCAGLTHYGTTHAPIVFGTGYVPLGSWWKTGLLMSGVNFVVWLGVGLPWWKLWGLW